MLQQKQVYSSFIVAHGFIDEGNEPEGAGAELDEMASNERDYVRRRLREELKREPTEQELDEWLRQHTEGY